MWSLGFSRSTDSRGDCGRQSALGEGFANSRALVGRWVTGPLRIERVFGRMSADFDRLAHREPGMKSWYLDLADGTVPWFNAAGNLGHCVQRRERE